MGRKIIEWKLYREKQNTDVTLQKNLKHQKSKSFTVIPSMTGTDGEATITILNLTVKEKYTLVKQFPDAGFGAWLIEQIYDTHKIFAVRKGFQNKKYNCPSCQDNIIPDLVKPIESIYDLKYKSFSPFTIKIVIPSVECPHCHKICGIDPDDSLKYHLNEAILLAFDSQKLVP